MSHKPPLPISVPIIARNEARNLERCLSSVAGWVGEIVVLLNDTTDESEAVARRFGAAVHHGAWLGFRDTKNAALALCREPWILSLDADEAISPELKAEIFTFFQGADAERFHGGSFPRKVLFLGRWIRHGDWYPDRNLRLFRRASGRWAGGAVHERVELAGPMKLFQADLHHHSFPDIATYVRKINVFADHFVQDTSERPRRWSLGETLFRPVWRFFRGYFLRLGCLDGFPGLFVAAGAAYACFIRYARLYERQQTGKETGISPPPASKESHDAA